jgi:hypothetical protein
MATIELAYRQAIVNYLRGQGAPTAIADVFLDVFNGDPSAGGTSVLATVTGSATRPSVKSALGAPTSADPAVSSNAAVFTLSASAVGVASMAWLALFDAATAGNRVTRAAVTGGAVSSVTGQPAYVPIGNLQIYA